MFDKRSVAIAALLASISITAHARSTSCLGVYVRVASSDVPLYLRAAPGDDAKPILRVQDMQYACSTDKGEVDAKGRKWELIYLVPFVDGIKPFEIDEHSPKVDNYSREVQELHRRGKCRLVLEGNDDAAHFVVKGQCPRGWVPAELVNSTGD